MAITHKPFPSTRILQWINDICALSGKELLHWCLRGLWELDYDEVDFETDILKDQEDLVRMRTSLAESINEMVDDGTVVASFKQQSQHFLSKVTKSDDKPIPLKEFLFRDKLAVPYLSSFIHTYVHSY